MWKPIFDYLNRPYPIIENNGSVFIMASFYGSFVALFLWIFQPFGIPDFSVDSALICLGYGLITFVSILFNVFVSKLVFPRQLNGECSKVGTNYIFSIWILVTISIGNWVFSKYLVPNNVLHHSFVQYLFITTAVGFFPMIISAGFLERKMRIQHEKLAHETNLELQNRKQKTKIQRIYFKSELKNESFELERKQLLCVKAEGNYCEIYFIDANESRKKLIRISLKTVEELLYEVDEVVKCHRSYLVNLQQVTRVSGTARNISLHFDNLEIEVPVSRAKEEFVTKAIRHIY